MFEINGFNSLSKGKTSFKGSPSNLVQCKPNIYLLVSNLKSKVNLKSFYIIDVININLYTNFFDTINFKINRCTKCEYSFCPPKNNSAKGFSNLSITTHVP